MGVGNQKIAAPIIPHPRVFAKVNTSAQFSCESPGQPLSSCFWAKTRIGERQVIVLDEYGVYGSEENSTNARISYSTSDELKAGKCGLHIEPVTEDDYGLWSCTLALKTGTIFAGEVTVTANGNFKRKLLHKITYFR